MCLCGWEGLAPGSEVGDLLSLPTVTLAPWVRVLAGAQLSPAISCCCPPGWKGGQLGAGGLGGIGVRGQHGVEWQEGLCAQMGAGLASDGLGLDLESAQLE